MIAAGIGVLAVGRRPSSSGADRIPELPVGEYSGVSCQPNSDGVGMGFRVGATGVESIDTMRRTVNVKAGKANSRKLASGTRGKSIRSRIVPSIVLVASLVGCSGASETGRVPGGESGGYVTAGDNVRLFYRALGRGRDTLVALHGGPGMDSEYLWPDFTPLFEQHVVVFYDQRGGGRSGLPSDTTALRIDDHVRDLEAVRMHLGLEKMVLIAHSFGPALAAMYAARHPERVARMIFLGAVPPRRGDFFERYAAEINSRLTEEEQRRLPELYEGMLSGNDAKGACREYWAIAMRPRMAEPERVSELKGDPCAARVEALQFGMRNTSRVTWASLGDWDFADRMAEVQAPTLVIHGEAEPIPMDLVEEWTAVLPHGRLLRIPGAAHFPYVERADLVWPAVEKFLTGVWPVDAMAAPGVDPHGGETSSEGREGIDR